MSLGYVCKEALSDLQRSWMMSLVSSGIMAISLLVLGIFGLVSISAYNLVEDIKKRVEIEAYLSDEVDIKGAIQIKADVEKLNGVEQARYIDKQRASEEFRAEFGDDLLDAVGVNPLPASIRITLVDQFRTLDYATSVVFQLEKIEGVEDVHYGVDWIGKLDRIVTILFIAGSTIGLVIFVACVFVTSNTAKLAVLSRRESIGVMKLVGATDRFIRGHFLVGGIIQGLVGGIVAGTLLFLIYRWTSSNFPELPLRSYPSLLVSLSTVVLGAILGGIGSQTSLRRVLNVLS